MSQVQNKADDRVQLLPTRQKAFGFGKSNFEQVPLRCICAEKRTELIMHFLRQLSEGALFSDAAPTGHNGKATPGIKGLAFAF